MTTKEIETQKALGTYLSAKWKEREELQEKADRLHAEARKLRTKKDKLYAGGNKLHIKANKLYIEGDELYIDAVIEVYGSKVVIDWNDGSVEINE